MIENKTSTIPFCKPYLSGKEFEYIKQAKSLSGDGEFTKRCHEWLEKNTRANRVLLANSCTAALEMAALLLDIKPGDEIIMPSFTFVSTANAFVLRGGIPVFVDIRPDTQNIDETLIEAAITPKTKAIVPVHYAGVACEMSTILTIAAKYNLSVIEDAAQGIMASYKNQMLGAIGHLGVYSFHDTKNIISGEGGALIINDNKFTELAEIIREKGTDRSRFFRGEIDKYTWQHIGSSFLPNELTAAFLLAQLEHADAITQKRLEIWNDYHKSFAVLESSGYINRPLVPTECKHNGHLYYLLLKNLTTRTRVLPYLKQHGISAVFHYVPLHSSPGGQKYGRTHGALTNTDNTADCLIRLPLFVGMEHEVLAKIIHFVKKAIYDYT